MYRLLYDRMFYPRASFWKRLMRWGVLLMLSGAFVVLLPELLIAFVAGFLLLSGIVLVLLSLKFRSLEKNMLTSIDNEYL